MSLFSLFMGVMCACGGALATVSVYKNNWAALCVTVIFEAFVIILNAGSISRGAKEEA